MIDAFTWLFLAALALALGTRLWLAARQSRHVRAHRGAVPEFTDHPKVINGSSDLFVEVFGEAGKHARSAVGMGSLPMGIPVEIEVIVEVA